MRRLSIVLVALLAAAAGWAGVWFYFAGQIEEQIAHWKADTEIGNSASLQRGARNFMGYCAGCHSMKYMRYSRMAADLGIPEAQLEAALLPAGSSKNDYITAPLDATDGSAWFGKAPPDLSLIARSRGTDYLYQFLKSFYADPSTSSGVNVAVRGKFGKRNFDQPPRSRNAGSSR